MSQILRRLRRSPSFTLVTILTLAIGIGANTAIFSVVNGVLIKPLPYPEPERLVAVWQTAHGINIPQLNAAPSTYWTYREEGRTFQDIGVWQGGSATITGLAEPEQVQSLYMTDGVLPILSVPPLHGRWFTREDDRPNAARTVILTHGYWRRRFASDPSVLGRAMNIDGRPHTVIGVMPERFRFLDSRASLLMTLKLDRGKAFVGNFSYQALARLKPGVTLTQANDDVKRMLAIMPQKFPPAPGLSMKVFEQARIGPDVHPLDQDVIGDAGRLLWVLMGSIGLLLLIACASVANLMLVRTEARQQELAVRAALGADWRRLAGELFSESMGLAMAGGVIGIAMAYGAVRALVSIAPPGLPRLDEIAIEPAVLAFAVAVSLVAGVLFGLIPVLKYITPSMVGGLREGGRGNSQSRERHRARNLLVVTQVALALVLLIGAGLMIRTIHALSKVQPGFTDPDSILTLRISIPEAQVKESARVLRMENDIADRIAAVAGVRSVGIANTVVLEGRAGNDPIYAEDKLYAEGQLPPIRRYKTAGPGFFKTMGNRLVAGRDFNWTDTYNAAPVVILSENLARELWQRPEAAIGKRVRESPKGSWREVIGVVGDERDDGLHRPAPAIAYWPLLVKNMWGETERVRRDVILAIRGPRAGSQEYAREVERAVWAVNPELPIASIRTLREIYLRSTARSSFALSIMAIVGSMALLLGVVGIYGVISYSVSRRTREIGIRMALGAEQGQVRRMFLRDGLMLAGVGVAIGLAVAFGATRLMTSLLFGVSAADPVTYSVVPLCLAIAAGLASYLPARRAAAVAPVVALRTE